MGTNTKPLNAKALLSAEQALDLLFRDITDDQVRAELHKWFSFGLNGEGSSIQNLPQEQLSSFADKLQDLVIALYAYQSEVRKEETNEH